MGQKRPRKKTVNNYGNWMRIIMRYMVAIWSIIQMKSDY